jgi:hypothetical protein
MSFEKPNQDVSIQSAKSQLPQYEEDFGHIAEAIIREAIMEKAGMIFEQVEKGDESEDKIKKIDFWIKLVGMKEPIAIQYTCSTNPETIKKKENYLRSVNYVVTKDPKENAEIDWTGKAHILLIKGNKKEMAHCWEESQKKGTTPGKEIGTKFVVEFILQMLNYLKKVNPAREVRVMEQMMKIKKEKNKKGQK